jgi:glycosyltransferase involved in cell wall biosynthesis
MRIAWVLYGDLAQRTGGTIYDAEVVDGLRRAGDDVQVVSLPRARLARELRDIAPDVVVGDELCFRELALAFRLLGRGGMRRVLLVHHLTAWESELAPLRRRVIRLVEALAMSASDRIVTTSQTTRRRLVAEGVRTAIEVVLPGANRLKGEREREREREREAQFVFVGAIVPRKRVVELVRAFAGGAGENGRLVLVGSTTRDEGYVRQVRTMVAQLGIGERVEMTGEVDEARVAQALDEADVLVMPSSLEGYGIAVTEAIYAGVPVIAARAQGLEEALAPCPDACMFADDERELASALQRFAADPALRASMSAAAREAGARMPTWSACADQFRAALRSAPCAPFG